MYQDELKLTPAEIIHKIMERFGMKQDRATKYVEETLGLNNGYPRTSS